MEWDGVIYFVFRVGVGVCTVELDLISTFFFNVSVVLGFSY